MGELTGSTPSSLDQEIVRGAEPVATQTNSTSSHSSTFSSDGGGGCDVGWNCRWQMRGKKEIKREER